MPGFAGFAPTKAAQRVLAESMARDLGPRGVHVGYVAIDAVIDLSGLVSECQISQTIFCKPEDIAGNVIVLHTSLSQPGPLVRSSDRLGRTGL